MCEAINELFAEAELNDTKNKLQEALEELAKLKAITNFALGLAAGAMF